MGFVRKNLGIDLTGGGQEDAAREAAGIQTAAGERALKFGAEQIGPFRDIGIGAGEQLAGAVLSPDALQGGTQFQGFNLDPSRVIDNPLFKALAGQQEQRLINQQAGLGRAGSGGTSDLLTQNILQLGAQFQDRDIAQQQQGFQNTFQTEQQQFQNQLAANQARFGQLFDQTRLGANAAAQQATSGQNILQGIGNVQAGVPIVGANAASALGQQVIGGLQGAGLGAAGALGPSIGAGASGAGAGFLAGLSDIRLKDNLEYVETIDGIDIFEWDWIEEAREIVGDQETVGPIAQLLEKTHPHLVSQHESGFKQVAAWR